MEELKNVKIVYMTIEEIKEKCLFFEENRNHYTDAEEASKHWFSMYDVNKTIKRIKSYRTKIFNKDKQWKDCCPMIVYKIDDKYFIVDGQGRFRAVEEYNKNNEVKINKIPVLICSGKTYTEMIDDALSLNMHQKNWCTEDVWRSINLRDGNIDKLKEMLKLKTQYENELEVKPYTSKLILFGYHAASHRDNLTSETTFSPYHKIIFEAFKTFYGIAVESCCGNKNDISTIKKQDAAQAFYKVMSYIIRKCKEENVDYTSHVLKASKILGNYVASLDHIYKFKQVFGGNEKAISSYFIKELNRKTSDRYIKQSLLKVA